MLRMSLLIGEDGHYARGSIRLWCLKITAQAKIVKVQIFFLIHYAEMNSALIGKRGSFSF